ncbi:MAG: toxin [Methyloprofundus sp.]|nr:MAG: toxin [Methyloprofundus sp.]
MDKRSNSMQLNKLKQVFAEQIDLELAILIGSQAQGNATVQSDWDIAIRWVRQIDPMQRIIKTENLRRILGKQLALPEVKIDLVELSTAKLAMCANVAEDGMVLKGEDSLAWAHFLQRTWRELENFYWDKIYATSNLSSRNSPTRNGANGTIG